MNYSPSVQYFYKYSKKCLLAACTCLLVYFYVLLLTHCEHYSSLLYCTVLTYSTANCEQYVYILL